MKIQDLLTEAKIKMPPLVERLIKDNEKKYEQVFNDFKDISIFSKASHYYVIPDQSANAYLIFSYKEDKNMLAASVFYPAHDGKDGDFEQTTYKSVLKYITDNTIKDFFNKANPKEW
jgi:hypothetical protein